MAHATSHRFGYDCGTCAEPVHYVGAEWFHNSRRVDCEIVLVVEVALTKVVTADSIENLELVA